ncbi:MAG: putative thymidylate kinase, partial [Bacteroidota bacterium]
ERILHLPTISAFIHQHQINVQLHYKLYLLYNISYYLNIYANQPQLHQQAHWLMEVWHQALKPLEPVANDGKMRHAFIKSLFEKMHQTKYAILKFTHSELSEINEYSDIDMIVLRNDRNKIVSYATTHPMVGKCKVYRKSFMTTVELYFKDQSFLSLDLITDFHRKDLQYIDARKFFTAIRYTFEKVKLPEERFCFEYTWLFYLLNASHMPPKYVAYYQSMSDTVKQHILNHIKSSYGLSIVSIEECFRHTKTLRAEVLKSLATKRSNSFTKRLKRKVNYYIDTIKDLVDRRGIVITFSGVDGAGKSTIINEVKHMLSEKFRKKVVVLRHRPSVVPILSALTLGKKKAEEISVSRLPRTGTNKNILLSYIRFAYYYSDYLLGQLYVFAKYSMRGYVVLYDRYYFDFIIDAKRSNMVLNENVTSWLYRFIYHPTLNLFLYAPVHIIKARKQELDDQAIEQLTSGYKKLFSKMSLNYQQRYIPLENVDKAQTLKFIEQEIIKAA